jgi:hypothetical protein
MNYEIAKLFPRFTREAHNDRKGISLFNLSLRGVDSSAVIARNKTPHLSLRSARGGEAISVRGWLCNLKTGSEQAPQSDTSVIPSQQKAGEESL